MDPLRIVLIEDDEDIRESLARCLRERRHDVLTAASGYQGMSMAVSENPDFVILDLGLPDLDGLDFLKMVRSSTQVPLLVASGRHAESQIIRALELGADDYVTKPYTAKLVEARMAAVRRRYRLADEQEDLQVGELAVDLRGHTAHLGRRSLPLRPKEFRLLSYLAMNAGRVVTKDELRTEIWDGDYPCTDKTVAVHLSWLRRHLGETAAAPRFLHTVRGVGIKLVEPPP
ncbi:MULTISPECIES: response regulator transcription factor [unclassified Streptomyces]|uniref:response regulator transcription factor n=1 Tax=unclassified Streptomyces TaxID=2593676 RepID=UPI00380CBF3B